MKVIKNMDIKFSFTDDEKLCLYDNGRIYSDKSQFIERYKKSSADISRAKKWKTSGSGAQFRGELVMGENGDGTAIDSHISSVCPLFNSQKIIYSFSINQTSGIYYKDFSLEKDSESHVINSIELDFSGCFCDSNNNSMICSVQKDSFTSDLAIFDLSTCEYKTLTDGETMDEYPHICRNNVKNIYFSSRGVGRYANGDFAGYSPSTICLLNLESMQVEEIKASEKFNYTRPVEYNGELFAIQSPISTGAGSNLLLEIIMLPVRFIQALANFIYIFIANFTGKSAVTGGNNPTRKREIDGKKIFIDGNQINLEKELKINSRKKDKDFGFIPLSRKLVRLSDGSEIFSGVADYDIDENGNIIVTNGRHIFAVKDGVKTKLADCEFCVNISFAHSCVKNCNLFDL